MTLVRHNDQRIAGICLAGLALCAAASAHGDPAAEAPPPGPPTEVAVTDRGTVRLHVADMPLSTVLHLLSLEGRRNIIASPKVKGTVTANLYDVTFDEALHAILVSNGAGYRVAGNFVYVFTNDELAAMDAARTSAPLTRVYHLNYIPAADAQTYLGSFVGEKGTIAVPPPPAAGLSGDANDGGGFSNAARDFIIVTAPEDLHATVRAILDQIDVRPKQVLIEATILRAELTDDNALGIDFTLVGGVDLELLGATSNGVTGLTLGQLPQERFEHFNANATADLTGGIGEGGLTLGIIKDQAAVFVRALEEVTDTTVLANPKVLALNKQKAQVIVGRRDGFLTTTVTETQAIQKVEFLETGTQLLFRPFIGDDGFVRVELHPEDSTGFVNAQGLPSEQTTEVTTNILVRDGQTILIGGLFREATTDSRTQIPGLGSLPGVGALFRSRSDSTGREEMIILLTVHVVKDYATYGKASADVFEDIERMRVGLRRGLMWFGRERLAQAHYRSALDALSAGKRDLAIWHLNLTLHDNARFLPAVKLKEKILSERAWERDGTGGRLFLHRLIARERGYALPLFGRPASPPPTPETSPSDKANDGEQDADPVEPMPSDNQEAVESTARPTSYKDP